MFSGLKNWYGKPFDENMSASRWFLWIGMIIVMLAIWKVIIWHLQEAA